MKVAYTLADNGGDETPFLMLWKAILIIWEERVPDFVMLLLVCSKSSPEYPRDIHKVADHGILFRSNLCRHVVGSRRDRSNCAKEVALLIKRSILYHQARSLFWHTSATAN
jgi:hypothetical protein